MSWNQDEPPTNPYRAPDWQFQQVPTAPVQPPQPPPRRRAWVLPAVAAGVAVILVGAAAGAYLLYGRPASSDAPAKPTAGTEAPTRPAATQPAAAAVLDVCTMLPVAEVDRLVPQAAVAKRSRDAGFAVYSYCDLSNRRISHGEFWRSREIKASIAQHRGEGPKTGRAQAQALYDSELGFFTYKAKNEPTDDKKDPGEKNYNSAVKHYPGVGDGAFGQYTWRRDKSLWYSFGEGRARVGDMIIEVRYQASQQRKDADFLSSKTTQSVSEENALREVGVLLTHLAKGAAAWKAAHPGELAKVEPSPTQNPDSHPLAQRVADDRRAAAGDVQADVAGHDEARAGSHGAGQGGHLGRGAGDRVPLAQPEHPRGRGPAQDPQRHGHDPAVRQPRGGRRLRRGESPVRDPARQRPGHGEQRPGRHPVRQDRETARPRRRGLHPVLGGQEEHRLQRQRRCPGACGARARPRLLRRGRARGRRGDQLAQGQGAGGEGGP
ncbi:hypothetical protein [Nonomuraea dietziae]|uniref:hypothetical protein n=1 Tax=Nonomuraea dietziae TaxID=65515 RepID=UPI0031D4D272